MALSKTTFTPIADWPTAMKIIHDDTLSGYTRVSVEGYDTSRHPDAIKIELMKHFRSCGEICDIKIATQFVTHTVVDRIGSMYFREEDAQEKAVALNGSDVGGWNVIVKALPKKVCEFRPDLVKLAREFTLSSPSGFFIMGFDASLPVDQVTDALFRVFSSCGSIIYISLRRSTGFISILGEGALEKALPLSGTDMGGWNVVVKPIPTPKENRALPIVGFPGPPGFR